jgi:hypothetical protein
MTEPLKELGDQVAAALPGDVIRSEIVRGELILWAERPAIVRVLTFLRDDPRMLFIPIASSVSRSSIISSASSITAASG